MHSYKIHILFLLLLLVFLPGCGQSEPITEENLTTYNITVPHFENEYNFLYLTDSHIIIPNETDGQQIYDYSKQRLSVFETQKGSLSDVSFTQWIDYANAQEHDGLLLGGDLLDSPSPSNIEYLNSSLNKLQIPYLYTLGNHDWTYPWNYMTEDAKENYLPLLSPFMNGNTAIHTIEYDEFTIVAIDNSNNQVNPHALEEYKRILAKKKPVILLLHVPLYHEPLLAKTKNVWHRGIILGGGIHGGIYPNDTSAQFLSLTTAKDSPVFLILAGHVHFADEGYVTGEKNILQIVGEPGFTGKGTQICITE